MSGMVWTKDFYHGWQRFPQREETMHQYSMHTLASLAAAGLLVACAPQPPRPAGLVNPASSHCHARGGRTLLGYTAEGRETLCFLPDGSLVDEQQLYRSDHPCR